MDMLVVALAWVVSGGMAIDAPRACYDFCRLGEEGTGSRRMRSQPGERGPTSRTIAPQGRSAAMHYDKLHLIDDRHRGPHVAIGRRARRK
jgi:hypothetical protein